MGQVIYVDGTTAGAKRAIAPSMRQPVGRPVSQWESIGSITRRLLSNFLESAEQRMNENGITKP